MRSDKWEVRECFLLSFTSIVGIEGYKGVFIKVRSQKSEVRCADVREGVDIRLGHKYPSSNFKE